MRRIVLEAVRAGAIGFATSTLEQHNGEDGMPMPSRLADEREMLALTGALGEAGTRRVHADQGHDLHDAVAREDRRGQRPAGDDRRDVRRSRRSARACSASSARSRRRARAAASCGRRSGCFPLGMEFTLRHPYPLEAFLGWRPGHRGRRRGAAIGACSPIPSFRTALKDETAPPGVPNRFSDKTWPHLTIAEVHAARAPRPASGADDRRAGRAIGPPSVRRASSTSASTASWTRCSTAGCSTPTRTRCASCCAIRNAAVALSDAGAHLSFLCDAGFGLHLFGHWVRERGDLTLEEAVQRVTSDVAGAYRIADRGRLAPGAWADLMLFDPETVGRGAKRRVNDLPTGATRARHAGGRPARRVGQRRAHGGRARRRSPTAAARGGSARLRSRIYSSDPPLPRLIYARGALMTVTGIDHIQLAMPAGREDEARAFYARLLGYPRDREAAGAGQARRRVVRERRGEDPPRGGAGLSAGAKAHPALLVRDLPGLVLRLREAGAAVVDDEPLAGYYSVFTADPFGNRLGLMEPLR